MSGAMGIEATNVSCQTASPTDFDAPDSLQLPAKRFNVRTLKYTKGPLAQPPCEQCFESNKSCYQVAKSTVSVCWECKVSGKKCSPANAKLNRKQDTQGMFITSPTCVLLTELYSLRRLWISHTRDLERIAVRAEKSRSDSRCIDQPTYRHDNAESHWSLIEVSGSYSSQDLNLRQPANCWGLDSFPQAPSKSTTTQRSRSPDWATSWRFLSPGLRWSFVWAFDVLVD